MAKSKRKNDWSTNKKKLRVVFEDSILRQFERSELYESDEGPLRIK